MVDVIYNNLIALLIGAELRDKLENFIIFQSFNLVQESTKGPIC